MLVGVVWDPTTSETGRVGPFGRTLILPRPEHPSLSSVFVCLLSMSAFCPIPQKQNMTYSLNIPELTKEDLEFIREGGTVTGLVSTVSDIGRARVGGVVSSTDTTAVQVLSTVGVGQGPLADKRPQGRVGVRVASLTDLLQISTSMGST
jgi:hypothetical protein